MLRITVVNSKHRRTMVLEGRLTDPWISELEQSWGEVNRTSGARTTVVDLKDVTAISERGEHLLLKMMVEGATFNCCRGVFTKHVLHQLKQRWKAQSRKG